MYDADVTATPHAVFCGQHMQPDLAAQEVLAL